MPRNLNLVFALTFLLLVAGGLYWEAGRMEQRYQADAEAYLRTTLRELSDWRAATLMNHLAPEAQAAVDRAQAQALLEEYRVLGKLRGLEEIDFSRLGSVLSVFGSQRRLSYSARGVYTRGEVDITVTLLPTSSGFDIYNLNFGRPALTQP